MKTSKQRREQRKRAKARPMQYTPTDTMMTLQNLMNAKASLQKADIPMTTVSVGSWYHYNDLLSQIVSPPWMIRDDVPKTQSKKDNNMCYECDEYDGKFDISKVKYDRLNKRLSETYDAKRMNLRTLYNLDEPESPETLEDFVSRITAGKFTFNQKKWDESKKYGYRINESNFISWRIPGVTADQAGFDIAEKKLDDAFEAAKDSITFTPTLDILTNFQSQTFN